MLKLITVPDKKKIKSIFKIFGIHIKVETTCRYSDLFKT